MIGESVGVEVAGRAATSPTQPLPKILSFHSVEYAPTEVVTTFARRRIGETATSFEHMRILAGKDGVVAFHGMPGGAPAVRFPLVKRGEGEAVFENPAHDYPQRIRYRLDGETLVATTSLLDGSEA